MEDIDSSALALAVIANNTDTIDPQDLKLLCTRFQLNLYLLLGEFNNERIKKNEARVVAIMEAGPVDAIPSAIGSFGIEMAFIAARLFPVLALPIIESKSLRSRGYYCRHMADAVAQSSQPQLERDNVALSIVTAYPFSAADVAEFHPHLKFRIIGMVPRAATDIAKLFPQDAIEIARISPSCAPLIAKVLPALAEELRKFYTIEQ
jgi:hypothetical protein